MRVSFKNSFSHTSSTPAISHTSSSPTISHTSSSTAISHTSSSPAISRSPSSSTISHTFSLAGSHNSSSSAISVKSISPKKLSPTTMVDVATMMWPPWWVQPWGVQGEPWRWGAPQTARTEGPRLENQSYQGARRGRRRRKHQRRGLNETRVPTTLEDTPLPQTTSQQRPAIPAPLPTTSQQTERAAIPAPLPTTSRQSESAITNSTLHRNHNQRVVDKFVADIQARKVYTDEHTIRVAVKKYFGMKCRANKSPSQEELKKKRSNARRIKLFERRSKWVKPDEMNQWKELTYHYMSDEESDRESGNGGFIVHRLTWRSPVLTTLCHLLDQRAEDSKKDTAHRSKASEKRTVGTPSMRCPPRNAPRWALDEATSSAALPSDHEEIASHSETDIDHDQDSATSTSC
ncbi:hypothetical protein EMCRGX_G007847 [Ephydatia muelleri]